jgi:hypothetical protein
VNHQVDTLCRWTYAIIPGWIERLIDFYLYADFAEWWEMRNLDDLQLAAEKTIEEIEISDFVGQDLSQAWLWD